MKKITLLLSFALVLTLGLQPVAAKNRPNLDVANSVVSLPEDEHDYLVGFSVDPQSSMVHVLNTGRDVINGAFTVVKRCRAHYYVIVRMQTAGWCEVKPFEVAAVVDLTNEG